MSDKICPYAKKCGGCDYQGMAYPKQLETKHNYIKKLLKEFVKVSPIVGMENPYHYRHKVIFSFYKNQKREICAGLYQEESHKIIEIKDCLIQNEEANKLINPLVMKELSLF